MSAFPARDPRPSESAPPLLPEGPSQALIDHLLSGILFQNAAGVILSANPAAQRILGLSLEDLRGSTSLDARWRSIHEDGSPFPGEEQPAALALRTGQPVDSTIMGVFNPVLGALRWIHVSATPLVPPGGSQPIQVMTSFVDITAHKRAEEALRESQARLQRAECAAHIGNWELDLAEGRFHASAGAGRVYGLPGEVWPLAEVQRIPLPEYRERLDRALADLVERHQPYEVEFVIARADDGERRVIRSVGEYDAARDRVFGVVQDITDFRRLADEKVRLEAQLHQAHTMESLGNLAGGVAHDMNNVLGAILGLASIHLELQPPGTKVHRAFDTIAKAAIRGGNLVKNLLSFARQRPAEERTLDLNRILREEVHLPERGGPRIRLHLDLDPDLRPVRGDGGDLARALLNLYQNAVEAMPEGGTLTLRSGNSDPGWVEVLVEDTGVGMGPEVRQKALDPFFTTKESGRGTGLGLSIVYSIMKAHQGQVGILSEPGRGTRVSLRLPALPAPATAPPPAPSPGPARRRSLDILLVDDDDLVQRSTEALLEVLGHRSTVASSGEEALEKLGTGPRPDLVILDLNMPGLGGAGTLPRLRALHPALPVLLATGRADHVAQALVDSYPQVTLLSKPFGVKELEGKLAPFLQG